MIEETAIVAKIENNQVWVESKPTSGCGGCQQKSACSTSVLDKFIHKRAVAVDCDIELKAGDRVIIAIDEGVLIRASLLLYLLPLLTMVAAGAVAQWLLPAGFVKADLVIAAVSLSSLVLSLFLINRLQNSFFLPYLARPVVLKKIGHGEPY